MPIFRLTARPKSVCSSRTWKGFLTAIAIGPDLIQPSEWLPVVWGSDEDASFESNHQAQVVIGAMMSHYNDILACVSSEPADPDPIFWETAQGEVIADDWAEGFVIGMRLRQDAWDQLLQNPENSIWLAPIVALLGANHDLTLSGDAVEIEKLRDQASSLISSCVVEIDRYWKGRRTSADAGRTR